MSAATSRKARKWADIAAIISGLAAIGNAMWGPTIFAARELHEQRGDPGLGYNWIAFGVGGLLAILGVAIAQRRAGLGRVLLAVGGLMLVIVPFAYQRQAAIPVITSVALGIVMLIATPFLGEMPAPSAVRERNAGAR